MPKMVAKRECHPKEKTGGGEVNKKKEALRAYINSGIRVIKKSQCTERRKKKKIKDRWVIRWGGKGGGS